MKPVRHETPLGEVLRTEGRTQAWLARTLDVQPAQVWSWVHGIHVPEDATRDQIATALGRTTDELWPAPRSEAA